MANRSITLKILGAEERGIQVCYVFRNVLDDPAARRAADRKRAVDFDAYATGWMGVVDFFRRGGRRERRL